MSLPTRWTWEKEGLVMETVVLVTSPTCVVCFNKNSCPNFLITIIHSFLLYWFVSVNHPRAYLNYGATQGTRRVLMHTTQALMRPWYSILGSCSVISVPRIRRHRRKRNPRHRSRRTSKLRKWTVFVPGPCHVGCSLRALTPVLPNQCQLCQASSSIEEYYNVIRRPRLIKLTLWLLCTLAIALP